MEPPSCFTVASSSASAFTIDAAVSASPGDASGATGVSTSGLRSVSPASAGGAVASSGSSLATTASSSPSDTAPHFHPNAAILSPTILKSVSVRRFSSFLLAANPEEAATSPFGPCGRPEVSCRPPRAKF